MEPKVVLPDDAHHISLYDVTFRYGVASDETDGTLAMLEVTIPPKTLVKPHIHTLEDEYSLILAGTVGARLGDNTVEEIPAGSWLVKPRSIPHAMWSVSDEPTRRSRPVGGGPARRVRQGPRPAGLDAPEVGRD